MPESTGIESSSDNNLYNEDNEARDSYREEIENLFLKAQRGDREVIDIEEWGETRKLI